MTVEIEHRKLVEGGVLAIGHRGSRVVLGIERREDGEQVGERAQVELYLEEVPFICYMLINQARQNGYTNAYLPAVRELLRYMDYDEDES